MIVGSKVIVVEILGEDEYTTKRGQKVIDTKIIIQNAPSAGISSTATFPQYMTVLVISELEYDDAKA